jgi:MerR family redox-sensitive transcriptional activator SoxR
MPETTPFELTIGELAERAGVQTSALRFYEKQGLIHSRRTTGNQRRYHRAMLRRVAFIRASASVGIPLEEIGEVMAFIGNDEAPGEAMWERAAGCWDKQLDERIARMQRMRDRLVKCVGCGCLSLKECHLINPEDKYAEEGPGPRRLIHD